MTDIKRQINNVLDNRKLTNRSQIVDALYDLYQSQLEGEIRDAHKKGRETERAVNRKRTWHIQENTLNGFRKLCVERVYKFNAHALAVYRDILEDQYTTEGEGK